MRDPIVQIPQQFDRAGSPIDQASAWSDARLQAPSPSGDDDCRHRTHASGQKDSVQTRDAWHQKQNRSRDLECGAFRVIRVKLQAPARLNFQSLHQSRLTKVDRVCIVSMYPFTEVTDDQDW